MSGVTEATQKLFNATKELFKYPAYYEDGCKYAARMEVVFHGRPEAGFEKAMELLRVYVLDFDELPEDERWELIDTMEQSLREVKA